MREIERQFDYKPESGAMRLLGVLMIILAPLAFWMSMQDDPGDSGLWMIGKGWFAYIPAPLVPWVVRALSFLLVYAGYLMIKGSSQMQQYGGRIAFTPTGMIYEAGPPEGRKNEIKYEHISDIRTSSKRGKKSLTFQRAGVGKVLIESSRMRSLDEFDEMAAMLESHVKQTALVAGAASG